MDDTARHTSPRRAIIAGIAGNVMEWYDFAVYGYFAQIIGQVRRLASVCRFAIGESALVVNGVFFRPLIRLPK